MDHSSWSIALELTKLCLPMHCSFLHGHTFGNYLLLRLVASGGG